MNYHCAQCGELITGAMRSAGVKDQWYDDSCWRKLHPFQQCVTFDAVLNNHHDQVLVRQLLLQYVPLDAQEEIIGLFNYEMQRRSGR